MQFLNLQPLRSERAPSKRPVKQSLKDSILLLHRLSTRDWGTDIGNVDALK